MSQILDPQGKPMVDESGIVLDDEDGPGITCLRHGIYGYEWPPRRECPYCQLEREAVKQERERIIKRLKDLNLVPISRETLQKCLEPNSI